MNVEIGEVNSTVRAVDGDALLAPQTLAKIVSHVLQAVQDEQDHTRRVHAERRITGSVRQESEEER